MKVESRSRSRAGGKRVAGKDAARRTEEAAPAASPKQASTGGDGASVELPPHLREALERLSERGVELVNRPGRGMLDEYKSAVRRFLELAMQDALKVRAESQGIFSRKIFATITRVDISLAELTEEVISAQGSIIKVARIVDDIKGLLIDLYR
jgi:uncharacterized protein YaaR (DUF327 family)